MSYSGFKWRHAVKHTTFCLCEGRTTRPGIPAGTYPVLAKSQTRAFFLIWESLNPFLEQKRWYLFHGKLPQWKLFHPSSELVIVSLGENNGDKILAISRSGKISLGCYNSSLPLVLFANLWTIHQRFASPSVRKNC
ncbi:hypothetical protein CW304_10055 [Bacillus sp. UFRGS-B20]|nr:hypothetical protein CW304_10055 [Bacillus sp. UFRGS-B20]